MSCPAAFPFSAGFARAFSGISPAHAESEADVDRKPAASDLLTRRVHYDLPGVDAVEVRRDVAYTRPADAELTMDVYSPPDRTASERTPAVVLVPGFPGAVKRIGSFVSWAELSAASGLVAITCATKEPVADTEAVLAYVREHAASLGVDPGRMGLWACSAHVPNALSLLAHPQRGYLKCAALCYGYMLDLDGSTAVADAARMYGFANPCSNRTFEELPRDTPLFIARAGLDETPGLNAALDSFVAAAVRDNRPVTFVNHATGPHAFDVADDSPATCDVIRQVLAFVKSHLSAADDR